MRRRASRHVRVAHVLENVPMLRNGTVRTRDTSQRMSRAVNRA